MVVESVQATPAFETHSCAYARAYPVFDPVSMELQSSEIITELLHLDVIAGRVRAAQESGRKLDTRARRAVSDTRPTSSPASPNPPLSFPLAMLDRGIAMSRV
jgi:hypothetical protein